MAVFLSRGGIATACHPHAHSVQSGAVAEALLLRARSQAGATSESRRSDSLGGGSFQPVKASAWYDRSRNPGAVGASVAAAEFLTTSRTALRADWCDYQPRSTSWVGFRAADRADMAIASHLQSASDLWWALTVVGHGLQRRRAERPSHSGPRRSAQQHSTSLLPVKLRHRPRVCGRLLSIAVDRARPPEQLPR